MRAPVTEGRAAPVHRGAISTSVRAAARENGQAAEFPSAHFVVSGKVSHRESLVCDMEIRVNTPDQTTTGLRLTMSSSLLSSLKTFRSRENDLLGPCEQEVEPEEGWRWEPLRKDPWRWGNIPVLSEERQLTMISVSKDSLSCRRTLMDNSMWYRAQETASTSNGGAGGIVGTSSQLPQQDRPGNGPNTDQTAARKQEWWRRSPDNMESSAYFFLT